MTLVSLTDCCRLLVIDPKTLRRWLSHCGLSAQPHPLDARCKCVTREQVEQLAAVHRRTLADPQGLPVHPEPSALSTAGRSAPVLSEVLLDFSAHSASLSTQLVGLQAHIATLEHQLALLGEQLQKEQHWRTSQAETFGDKSSECSQEKSLEHYNRTCLKRVCPKALLKKNGSVYQSEVISDCSEVATCSKRAMVRRSVVPRERLWERPWKVR